MISGATVGACMHWTDVNAFYQVRNLLDTTFAISERSHEHGHLTEAKRAISQGTPGMMDMPAQLTASNTSQVSHRDPPCQQYAEREA